MSPPPAQDPAVATKAQHKQTSSANASPRPDSTKASKSSKQAAQPPNVHYTLLIKLPFPRGDFEDPPQVEWDASKDRKLWKIISKNSKSASIDWAQHAQEFGVTQPFLLQQAAWLYERHFQHVKAQMTKLRTSNAPTPVLGSTSQQTVAGGVPMKRLGSGGGGASRAPSSMSIRSRDSPVPRADVIGGTGTPSMRPELSRTPSAATVTQSRPFLPPSSPRQPVQRSFRSTATSRRTEATPLPAAMDSPTTAAAGSPPASESTSTSSSSADEDSDAPPTRQSQLFRRPPPFQRHKKTKTPLANVDDTGEDSGDDSPTFLPFAAAKGGDGTQQPREDISATLRDNAATPPRTTRTHPSNVVAVQTARANASAAARGKGKQPVNTGKLESSASSVSSTAATPGVAAPSDAAQQHRRQLDALSPRHRAELARLSPRRQGTARDGSDGTPSMGSSFSDLDDTSITQSALEEALASNFRHGGASRLSTISHAFGSRLYGRGQGQG